MSDADDFIKTLNADPIQIKYTRYSARKLLSGQVTLPHKIGQGMLNKLVIKEGNVLSSNVEINFHPYNETLFFHTRDRLLIEAIVELIRHKYDKLTSAGLCVKPIYSRPTGYIHESGNKDNPLYTYSLESLLNNKKTSLPYYLYMQQSDGTHLADALPILARRISVHIQDDIYLHFKPNIISVSEVMDLCRHQYEENKPEIFNTQWGLKDDDVIQVSWGKFERNLHSIDFELSDLLEKKAYLPLKKSDTYRLTKPVGIIVNKQHYLFAEETEMSVLWDRWKPISADTPCVCDYIATNLCIFKAVLLLNGDETLPSIRGLVLKHRIAIEFDEGAVKCYPRNSSIQSILWQVHRLIKSNEGRGKRYRFIHSGTKKLVNVDKWYKSLLDLREVSGDIIDHNAVILLGSTHMPFHVSSGMNLKVITSPYNRAVKIVKESNIVESSTYKMWKDGKRRA